MKTSKIKILEIFTKIFMRGRVPIQKFLGFLTET